MDLRLTIEAMFHGENVSPDFSSYQNMVAKWRSPSPAPRLSEVEAYWDSIQNNLKEGKAKDKLESEGITLEKKLDVLWNDFVNGKTENVVSLQNQIQAIKNQIQ